MTLLSTVSMGWMDLLDLAVINSGRVRMFLHAEEPIFTISLLPIRLTAKNTNNNQVKIIWNNPRPSSTRLCRPIKFFFQKENTKLIKDEAEKMNNSIEQLEKASINTDKNVIFIKHCLIFSKIDGKVMQALTDTKSSQTCVFCGASLKEMNNISAVIDKEVQLVALQYGLSPLHSYIRFYEYILHIAYRLDFLRSGRKLLKMIKIYMKSKKAEYKGK